MRRVYNFSAGPSMMPEEVLLKARDEMLDYRNSGMSVMEISHRSALYSDIHSEAIALLSQLLKIPAGYGVLFLQGGASTQFAMIPLNLTRKKKAAYVNTGNWSKKAIAEAARYTEVDVVASSENDSFTYIPDIPGGSFRDADYLHITTNNTIVGTRFPSIPDTGDVPLVGDLSSNILSEVYNVSRFGLIYAGAQKNAGPAGLTIVIVREDLTGGALDITPTMLDYKIHLDKKSLYNTPPCYSIYVAKLMFEWVRDQGGVEEIEKRNRKKARILYEFLDNSDFYTPTARAEHRSLMNVPFVLRNDALTQRCIEEAGKEGLVTLKGHRSVGGMRASIYNAMPLEGVEKLVSFLKNFEMENK